MISNFNFIVLAAAAVAALYAVLCPHIKDGVVIKIGLIAFAFGALSLAIAQFAPDLEVNATHALALINGGCLVALGGYMLRRRKAGPLRRMSDWADSSTYDPPTSPLRMRK